MGIFQFQPSDQVMARAFNLGLRCIGLLLCWSFAASAFSQINPIQVRFEPGCEAVKAYFTNMQPGAGQVWDLGDGTTSTALQPTHEFPYGAIINVSLTLDLGDGEFITFALDVSTPSRVDLSDLQFPNVFTPNGDGINDTFGPLTDQFLGPCSQLSIFNRFGQRLFDGAGNSATWDGRTFAGVPATEGTYFYVFKVNGLEFTGYLSLHL